MTREQKLILEPYAKQLMDIVGSLGNLSPAELQALKRACDATSNTNCGWDVFAIARIIEPQVRWLLDRTNEKGR